MGAAWDEAMKKFEAAHPGVKLQFESKGVEQIRQTASMILNSDEAPDVMEYNKGNATAGLLSKQGLLTDITSVAQSRGWDKILGSSLAVEAAPTDGCGKVRLLLQVVAPVSMPTLRVLFVFFFIWTWNEFFLPLITPISDLRQTVPIAISTLQGQHNMDATTASASALLGLLPCIIFFAAFQRTLTRGITAGSIR
jgi:hypothetical protein